MGKCMGTKRPGTFWRTWLRPSHMSVNPIVFDKKSLLFPDAYAFFLFLFQRLRLESFVVFTNKEISSVLHIVSHLGGDLWGVHGIK